MSDIKDKFEKFHEDNPHAYEQFKRFAFEAIKHNKNRISHWLIANRVRWEAEITTTGVPYKINNNFIAFYARMWQKDFPEHSSLFKTKQMKHAEDEYV